MDRSVLIPLKEDSKTITDFYFGEWDRDMDETRRELYKELHDIYGLIRKGIIRVPDTGYILELGVNGCVSFNELCDIFDTKRCVGFDLENVTNHPRVAVVDVRKMDGALYPAALCVNEVGGWTVTPESRKAAYDWMISNMLPEGVIIEHSDEYAGWDITEDLKDKGFKVVWMGPIHIVMKKL